ncbi:MAG: hypothetical protein ACREQV_20750 [Candidatus Binatia bacterium]
MQFICFSSLVWLSSLALLPSQSSAEILYERKLTEEEGERYQIRGTILSTGIITHEKGLEEVTIEDIRKEYASMDWEQDWKTVKVELLYKNGDKSKPQIKITHLGEDLLKIKRDETWQKEAPPRVTLGKDALGFKHEYSELHLSRSYNIFYEEAEGVGWAFEKFTGPNDALVTASLYEVLGHELTVHEFLHQVIRWPLEVKQTAIGAVLVGREPLKTPQGRPVKNFAIAAWTSGDNLAIYISGRNVSWQDLVRLYGSKFPSSLPKDLKLDKTAWGRREVELTLSFLKKSLANTDPPGKRPYFPIRRARDYVYIPPWEALVKQYLERLKTQAETGEQKRKHWQESLEAIGQWWRDNREKTYWDDDIQMLAAKGQTPQEIADAARQRAEAELAARKKVIRENPLAAKQIADLKTRLIKQLEGAMKREDVEIGDHNFGLGSRVRKWKRVGEEKWGCEFPSSLGEGTTHQTFTGPVLEMTADPDVPVKAIFTSIMIDPNLDKPLSDEAVYHYDRLKDEWINIE